MAISSPEQRLEARLRAFCHRLRADGLIDDWDIFFDVCRDYRALRFRIHGTDHWVEHSISLHELRMGDGGREFERWMRFVHEDLRNRAGQIQQPEFRVETIFGYQTLRYGVDWAAPDPKAQQRARDLFRACAGEDAYRQLDNGNPIDITGSRGTRYRLHPVSSFCVERMKDGARLCAVVPGVPLWDHLLGIKLMIEHEEERFLKTANVSGGVPSGAGVVRRIMERAWP